MTIRQIYEGLLTELNKVNAPPLLLQEFNYLINKAIQQRVNKSYNVYDINQQTSDSLRVLKSRAHLPVTEEADKYVIVLPDDYLHILNCICNYTITKGQNCNSKQNTISYPAKRLTADSFGIINNYYNRPTYKRPYYYISNINQQVELPTNAYNPEIPGSTDGNEFPKTIKLQPNSKEVSTVNKSAGVRYGNPSKIRCEIRCGNEHPLSSVDIEYIKTPQYVELSFDQLQLINDTSQIIEFPDYECHEIINELVHLVMGQNADPRLQSHSVITSSIANPVQQQK